MKIDILTLFPEFTNTIRDYSIIKRAILDNIVEINSIDIREFSLDKHKKVDDYSYGGGPGMVMTPQPIVDTIKSVRREESHIIFLSPRGKPYNQKIANKLAQMEHIVLLCGHYEGVDQRVLDNYVDEEISIGDYILTGGEVASFVLIDSIIRLIPGALGNIDSSIDESFTSNLLEFDQYTRPEIYEGHRVPEVLLSGNHKLIEEYRLNSAIKNTIDKRPDLLKDYEGHDEKIAKIIKQHFSLGGKDGHN